MLIGFQCRRVVLLAVVACSGCGSGPKVEAPAKATTDATPLKVEVLTVQSGVWPSIVKSQGSLAAHEVAVLGAKVAGRVEGIQVDLGDAVLADAPVVTLDQTEFALHVAQADALLLQSRAAIGLNSDAPMSQMDPQKSPPVREAKAVLDDANLKRERVQRLLKKDAATEEEYEQAVAAVNVAEARFSSALNSANERMAQVRVRAADLAVARQRLEDAVILSPFEGTIQQRHVARGTFVQVGSPLVTLVKSGKLRFHGTLPERHAQRVLVGQKVTLVIESLKEPIEATVNRISPVIDDLSRSLVFEAQIDNPDGKLRSGLFAEAELVVDAQAVAISVPDSAVLEFAGVEKVWKVVDGAANEQVVQTGRRKNGSIEIVSGLTVGDQVLMRASAGRVAPVEALSASAVKAAETHGRGD